MNHVVFADPNNKAAKNLQADALSNLATRRSRAVAQLLSVGRQGTARRRDAAADADTASPDTVRAMTPEMFFDYLGIRLNGSRAADASLRSISISAVQVGSYLIELENGVLNHTANRQSDNADATVTLTRETLNRIILHETSVADAISSGDVRVNGNQAKLDELISYLDTFEFWFNIVTP